MANLLEKRVVRPAVNALGSLRVRRRFSQPPILIGGCARSGTTLLLSILDAHPHIHCIPYETGAFTVWRRRRGTRGRLAPKRMDRLHRHFLTHRIPAGATRWCEKTPANVRHIQELFDYFDGNARFIHIIRDARDVLTSRHPLRPDEYWVTPQRWVDDVRAGLAFQGHPNVFTLRYEDLVADQDGTLRRVLDFLGEDYTPELEQWVGHTGVRKDRAWDEPVQGVHAQSVHKWEKPEHAARTVEIFAHPDVVALLDELGYCKAAVDWREDR